MQTYVLQQHTTYYSYNFCTCWYVRGVRTVTTGTAMAIPLFRPKTIIITEKM